MKIAFVLDDSLDVPDGVQQYVLAAGAELSRRDHNVHYLVGDTSRSTPAQIHSLTKNVRVQFNKNRMRTPLPADTKEIRRILAREKFDVLHVQAPYSPLLVGRVIAESQRLNRRPRIVATWHIAAHSRLVELGGRTLRRLDASTLVRIDAHIAVSKTAANFASKTFRVQSTVIPCPVDIARLSSKKVGAAGASSSLAKNSSAEKRIVFFGRLVERKGPDKLLTAVKIGEKMCSIPPNTKIIVAGDGPMRAKLEMLASTLKTPVEFIGRIDFKNEPKKIAVLASADVAVFPSLAGETFGIVLAEAMAAGAKVVLAGDNPGYRDTMESNSDLLFNPEKPKELASKLHDALTSTAFMKKARAFQKRRVRDFDVARVTDQIMTLYKSGR